MQKTPQTNGQRKLRYIDLFAGVGGFSLALERLGHECVYANDIDKYCKIIYEKNFKRSLDNRSITSVPADGIPDHELLCGGFPCQSFSIAGKRRGFEDRTRGTLFFDIARIAKQRKPRLLLLENVKGLLSHDKGKTFFTIISTLDELGYDCQWQVLNSKDFGVPQNRERIFIVGHLRGTSRPKVFPLGKSKEISIKKDSGITYCLDANYGKGVSKSARNFILQQNQRREIRVKNQAGTITADQSSTSNFQAVLSYPHGGYKGGVKSLPNLRAHPGAIHNEIILQDIRRLNKKQNGKGFKQSQNSYTVDTLATQGVLRGMEIRRLTPVECERLQGFPDGWTEGVSDTQRYKQMGNAVTVNVVYEIAKRL